MMVPEMVIQAADNKVAWIDREGEWHLTPVLIEHRENGVELSASLAPVGAQIFLVEWEEVNPHPVYWMTQERGVSTKHVDAPEYLLVRIYTVQSPGGKSSRAEQFRNTRWLYDEGKFGKNPAFEGSYQEDYLPTGGSLPEEEDLPF
jgi:hypothetical protein